MDLITIGGLIIGIGGILLGSLLEGGDINSLVQFAAAAIVFGGTAGAVLVATRKKDLLMGLKLLKWAFIEDTTQETQKIANEILEAAKLARKETILSLEKMVDTYSSAFMRRVLSFAIDGAEPSLLNEIFTEEIDQEQERLNSAAKIWTDAGGFAPTIGIIGAVLGLIHVMSNLTDTAKLGAGIAVAFVATIYGVGSANLIFIPLGNKIKRKIARQAATKQMILTGIMAIVAGRNQAIIQHKLLTYMEEKQTLNG